MKKLNVTTHTKLITGGAILLLVGNPLSLAFLADGAEIAMMWLNELVQLAFVYAVEYSWVFVGLAVVLIVFGAGLKMGSDNKKYTKKLKSIKTSKRDGMQYEV